MAGQSPSLSSTARPEEKYDAMSLLDQFYAYCNATDHNLQNRPPQPPPPPPRPQQTLQRQHNPPRQPQPPPPNQALRTPGAPSSMASNWQQESHHKAEIAVVKRKCEMVLNIFRQRPVDHRIMRKMEGCVKYLNDPQSDISPAKLDVIKKFLLSLFQKRMPKKTPSSLTSAQSSTNMLPAGDARQVHSQAFQSGAPADQQSLQLSKQTSQVLVDPGHGKSVHPQVGTFQGSVVNNGSQSTKTSPQLGFLPAKRGRPRRLEKSEEKFLLERPDKKVQKRQGMQDVKVKCETQEQQVLYQKPAPLKAVMHSQINQLSATQPPCSFKSELQESGEVTHHTSTVTVSGRKETEQPFRHLVNLVQLISGKALSASVNEIWSIVRSSDGIPEARNTKRSFDVVSLNSSSPFDADRWTASIDRNQALQEEVRAINQQLVDTDVAIIPDANARTIMKCSFNAVSISPTQPIEPLKLLVPSNYPQSSPIFLETLPVEINGEEDLSVKAKSRLNQCLRSLLQPVTLEDIARSWDVCARQVITEYALQNGGGSFSTQYGSWETVCNDAAY